MAGWECSSAAKSKSIAESKSTTKLELVAESGPESCSTSESDCESTYEPSIKLGFVSDLESIDEP